MCVHLHVVLSFCLLALLICFGCFCPIFFFCNVLFLDIVQGGPGGAERLHRCTTLKKLLKEQKQASRMYGGICYSPLILQKQGLLQVFFQTKNS